MVYPYVFTQYGSVWSSLYGYSTFQPFHSIQDQVYQMYPVNEHKYMPHLTLWGYAIECRGKSMDLTLILCGQVDTVNATLMAA